MKFSVMAPTSAEGLSYPIPIIKKDTFVKIAQAAEKYGYYSIWGNDHITTQEYVQKEFTQPPSYYEPLITLASLVGYTKRLRLSTGVIVLPLRQPVILAKQIAALDVLSEGRLDVALGIGAYREEFDAMFPKATDVRRGDMFDEGIQCLLMLLKDKRASFEGQYYSFRDIEAFPKPVQDPFPLWIGGNHPNNITRVARWAQGWNCAALRPEELRANIKTLYEEAARWGRENIQFEIAPQYLARIGKSHEEAVARFSDSQLYKHFLSLSKTTMKGRAIDTFERNMIGTANEIGEKIHLLEEAGMTHCAALVFAANSDDEIIDQMAEFGENVLCKFE